MKRYNSLNNSKDGEEIDTIDHGTSDGERESALYTEMEFDYERKYTKTLCLVFTLFFGGLFTLITSTAILLGHLDSEIYADRMIPLMILGLLMLIPGGYYFRIAFYAWRGRRGYNYDQIPSCY